MRGDSRMHHATVLVASIANTSIAIGCMAIARIGKPLRDVVALENRLALHARPPAGGTRTPARHPACTNDAGIATSRPARALTVVLGLLGAAATALAQPWPSRPVRIVVPYAPGGGGDQIARLLAPPLADAWGQPVVVDNRPGGGTVPGTDLVARASPDGHTLLVNTSAITINPALLPSLPYDTLRDLAPVTQVAVLPNLLVVHPSLPVNSVRELIAHARSRGDLTFGSSGTGTGAHLAGELFRSMAGISLTHVPYKGGAAVMPDLMAGRIHMTFATVPSSLPYVKSGRLRALAVTGGARSSALPDTPTIAEAALPGYDATNWLGLFARAGTPEATLAKVHRDLRARVIGTALGEQIATLGFEPVASDPKAFEKVVRDELRRWRELVASTRAKDH